MFLLTDTIIVSEGRTEPLYERLLTGKNCSSKNLATYFTILTTVVDSSSTYTYKSQSRDFNTKQIKKLKQISCYQYYNITVITDIFIKYLLPLYTDSGTRSRSLSLSLSLSLSFQIAKSQ